MADLMEIARAAAKSIEDGPEESYTLVDLEEMDRLLRELAELEGWTKVELADRLDQRRRMAPINVPTALRLLRAGARDALAVWPEKPAKRVPVVLCVIDGGKK